MLAFKMHHDAIYHREIIKVYGKIPDENVNMIKAAKKRNIVSLTNKEIYWHIGIIDYL